jgi:hypothetical protein
MIGEIRDKETAQIAFRASITGHLVLTTVHTNDAASAVTRLVDLGLEPFMVSSSLIGVVSMRLLRTLCPRCRETYEVAATTLNRLGAREDGEKVTLSRGRGCPHCRTTGFHGRTGVFEALEVTDAIKNLIIQRVPDATIRAAAIENGMRTLGEDGLRKVMEGRTTLDEVTRVIYLADQGGKVCPACAAILASDFDYCPSCGEFVGEHCESCRRRLLPGWTFCPFCGEGANGTHTAAEATGQEAGATAAVETSGPAGEDRRTAPGRRTRRARPASRLRKAS